MRVQSVLLLLVMVCGCTIAMAHETVGLSDTTSLYGYLHLPPGYYSHPDSSNPLNHVQPGSVLLTDGSGRIHRVPVRKDGIFVAYNLPFGSYLLQADYHDFTFPTVRADVHYRDSGAGRTAVIHGYTNDWPVVPLKGTGLEEESPLVIAPTGVHRYFIPREQFRITDILRNPMIIMMILSVGMMAMMKMMPEEDRLESQRMMKKMFNPQASVAENPAESAATIKAKKNN